MCLHYLQAVGKAFAEVNEKAVHVHVKRNTQTARERREKARLHKAKVRRDKAAACNVSTVGSTHTHGICYDERLLETTPVQ